MLVPAKEVRMRRDFPQVLTLIQAHALLHQQQRERDARGRIAATLQDYRAVYQLVAPLYEALASGGVTAAVREAVEVVTDRCAGDAERTVSVAELAQALGIDKSAASQRVKQAVRLGYLVNLEARRGYPARLCPGDPLPERIPALPNPTALENRHASPERNSATPGRDADADFEKPLPTANATVVQQCNCTPGCCTVAHRCIPRDATDFGYADAETGRPLQCYTQEQRSDFTKAAILDLLAARRRATVWQLAWETGLLYKQALDHAKRLLETEQIRREGHDLRAPLSVWSEVMLAEEMGHGHPSEWLRKEATITTTTSQTVEWALALGLERLDPQQAGF